MPFHVLSVAGLENDIAKVPWVWRPPGYLAKTFDNYRHVLFVARLKELPQELMIVAVSARRLAQNISPILRMVLSFWPINLELETKRSKE
jgi:hypothetical protein